MSSPIQRKSMKVVGYTDTLSVQAGQEIRFMVSCEEPRYHARIVRLIHGDNNPKGPGFKEEAVRSSIEKDYDGRVQPFHKGSYITIPCRSALRKLKSLTVQAWIYPTTPKKGLQAIASQWGGKPGSAYAVFIDENGELAFWVRGKQGNALRFSSGVALHPFNWYFIAASYDGVTGKAALVQQSSAACDLSDSDAAVEQDIGAGLLGANAEDLVISGYREGSKAPVTARFNGKIDGAKLFSRRLLKAELKKLRADPSPRSVSKGLVAAWDFAANQYSTTVKDLSPNRLNGHSVNFPTRAVTGHNWSGREQNYKHAPEEYNSIYFHDDDLGDAGWDADFAFAVPTGLKSGVYAAHLSAGDSEDYVPFFVRPKRGKPTARICLLIPTMSYLAYGNEHTMSDPAIRRSMGVDEIKYPVQPQDVYIVSNNLLSLYDHHTDGSGVCYTSRRRPIANMRPKYVMQSISSGNGAPHQFNADLHLVDWLVARGFEFDVITDEDLHHEGFKVISRYKVVVTGSHPEYWSGQMLDAINAYLNEGGRLMYMGGNGFYWVTTPNPENPYIFEVRRWGGTGAWMANPGEYYSSFSGELGGLWRNRGRHPQKLLGIGFSAQGFDVNKPYKRRSEGFDTRASFIFEGIGREELIGDTPSLVQETGAAGFELDRLDFELGTPRHALLLATATGFSDNYQHVIEENTLSDSKQGGTIHPLVKADIVYVKYPKNGAVFSVGSIAWCGSLSYNNYANNVSTMTGNVLRKFADSDELP